MSATRSTNPSSASRTINSLSEFLLQAHTQHLVLDLGRGLKKIDNQVFFEWENQVSPCLYPRQDHAWFCIAFWNEKLSSERYIWFIKLPLDENGLMIQASRNQFLEIVMQALGNSLQHTQNEKAQLPENPYIFTPSQQQLADCNAHIKKHLGIIEANDKTIEQYLQAPSVQDWQSLKLQDIANFVCNSTETQQSIIAQNLSLYPNPVANCLLASFEAIPITSELVTSVVNQHKSTQDLVLKALLLRSMSFQPKALCIEYVSKLITSDESLDVESLVVISGRYWAILKNTVVLIAYAEKIARADNDYSFFRAIFADLVKIPEIRQNMLDLLRNSQRSAHLSAAIGSLFSTQNK